MQVTLKDTVLKACVNKKRMLIELARHFAGPLSLNKVHITSHYINELEEA